MKPPAKKETHRQYPILSTLPLVSGPGYPLSNPGVDCDIDLQRAVTDSKTQVKDR